MIIGRGGTVSGVWQRRVEFGENLLLIVDSNNKNKRPLTPKSMPPAGDEHAKLKT